MSATVPNGLPQPQRSFAMLTVCLGVLLTGIDSIIANIALPTIVADLHSTASATVWVVTAYQLSVTMCVLPAAALGERVGARWLYLAGLAVFTAASLGCAAATSLPMLVAFRAVQGLGGAGLVAVSLALVRMIQPRDRLGRGLGLYATMVALSMAAGPSVAAVILTLAHWPWLFAVNVPTGIIAVCLGIWALPASPGTRLRIDLPSVLLNAASLGLVVIGVDGLGEAASRPMALGELAGGLALGAVLIQRERRRTRPLVPVDLLRLPLFGLSALTSLISYATLIMAFVCLPFMLQDMAGRGATATGLLITPWPLGIMVGAQATGRLSDRYPAGILASIGLLVMALGLLLLGLMPDGAGDVDIALRMAVGGLGFGFFQTPNNRTMMTAGPPERAAAASGMLATCRLLGMSLGAAMAAVLLALVGTRQAHIGLLVGMALSLAAALVSAARLRVARR